MGGRGKSPARDEADSKWQSEYLEAIVECAPDLIAAKDTDLKLRYCNRAFLRQLGKRADELLGKLETESGWIPQTVAAEERSGLEGSLREDREALDGKTVFVPSRQYQVAGAARYFDVTRGPISTPEGKIVGVLCVWHDVTTFHTAVEELREAAERYRAMSEYSYEWEVWQDAEGRILYLSPSFARITGYSTPDFLANPERISSIIHPEDRARYEEHRTRTVRERSSQAEPEIEFRIVRKDGEVRWVRHYCISVFRPDGTYFGRRASNRDITETRLAEERLRASEQKFRLVFENSPHGKSVTSVEGFLEVNRAFCDLLGYSAEELRSKNWRDITHPDDIATTERAIAPLLAGTAAVARFEKRYLHKSGKTIRAEVVTALQRDQRGNPLFFITSISDITSSRSAARE